MKRFFTLLVIWIAIGTQYATACEGCRAPGVEGEYQTVMAGVGFSWSIILMLTIVFSILSGLTWFITKTCRMVDQRNNPNSRSE
ncbi:MAG: hypothetical protein ABI443_10645 [Chthoniobacterales bacterium]